VRGDTNRTLQMRAYGYVAGDAQVTYRWSAVDTCNEVGSGRFSQRVPRLETALVGVIPKGEVNVSIQLASSNDIDVQLFDGATALVKWPDGMLRGPTRQSLDYEGMRIEWSGYSGDGNGLGHEYIRIDGAITRKLTMKVFGYREGDAMVTYEWGIGAGKACGPGKPDCGPALSCKAGDGKGDACHTASWCASDASAPVDCAALEHPPAAGRWTCETFECTWKTSSACDSADDCGPSQYCSDGGFCLDDGTCEIAGDCTADGNEWDVGACVAPKRWEPVCEPSATCGYACSGS